MKNRKKRISMLLCIMLAVSLLPVNVQGATQEYTDLDGIKYELSDTGEAVIIEVPTDATTVTVPTVIQDGNGTSYQVTGIQNDALSGCSSLTDLIFTVRDVAPDITGDSGTLLLPYGATIYISQKAQGYTAENGWPEEHVQTYKITRQPIDITIPEGWAEQGDIHQIAVEAEYPASGGSLTYQWYSCSGTDKSNAQPAEGDNSYDYYQIPEDLTAGTYYYFCRIGAEGEKQLDSDVATVTVMAEPQETFRVIPGLTEVPATLQTEYDSVEEIKDVMVKEAAKNGKFDASHDNTVIYDVFFMQDGLPAEPTEDDFPLTITLPYPEGTNGEEYEFTVVHMFTTTLNGGVPGKMETLKFKETNEGLETTVNSLSPFTVSYQKADNAQQIIEASPATGDNTQVGLWIALMGIAAAVAAFDRRSRSVK